MLIFIVHLHRMGNLLGRKVKCADSRRAELLSAVPAAGNDIKPLCTHSSGEPDLVLTYVEGQLRSLCGDFIPGTKSKLKLQEKKVPQGSCCSPSDTDIQLSNVWEEILFRYLFLQFSDKETCANISCKDLEKQIKSKLATVNRYQ